MTVDTRKSVIDSAQRLQKTLLTFAKSDRANPSPEEGEALIKDAFNVGMHFILATMETADAVTRMANALERIADTFESMASPVGDLADGEQSDEHST